MSNISHEYNRMKSQQELDLKNKQQDNKNIQFQHLSKHTTTNHSSIPNMDSGYEPTDEEIHYRRYTGGRPVDTNGK
ncbi:MAG: hypothetical protein ISQ90_08040 [Rhodospirillales bacterium]|jgi:hypothetical protein|nr:hypothetical protein [Rhodospirillales bacterium]